MHNFFWTALLKNGQLLFEDEKHSFKEVQEADSEQRVKRFSLTNKLTGDTLSVCLDTGYLYSNFLFHHMFPHPQQDLFRNATFRLIYFRRNRLIVGKTKKQVLHRYAIGWQCTIDGVNYQRILFLDPRTSNFEIKGKR